ncbi:WD40-repeat-containing domain protein [Suillus spraguei]|nr:WD40-repeat-containing domain protein [Suillus spraguei]
MIEGIWTGHTGGVRSLSWSPSGDNIASGSNDGTILIRKAGSGDVEVEPIESKQAWVLALAYSPSGDRIASGGSNKTLCIWDSKTGQLVVDPVEGLGTSVTSIAWSLDSTKLYAASDNFARVFDSSGTQLHHLEQNFAVNSVALSPKHNLLVCVGCRGIAQLWDTVSHQPLGQSFQQHEMDLCCASFSQDGRYLVYGGYDRKISLWVVKDIAHEIAEIQSSRPSLDGDATNRHAQSRDDEIFEDVRDDPYGNFFQSSYPSVPSRPSVVPSVTPAFFAHRFMSIFTSSQQRQLPNQPTSSKRRLFARHTGSQPVIVSAGRSSRRYWVAAPVPVRTKAQVSQPPSQTAQLACVTHPQSTPPSQPSKTEPVTQDLQTTTTTTTTITTTRIRL